MIIGETLKKQKKSNSCLLEKLKAGNYNRIE